MNVKDNSKWTSDLDFLWLELTNKCNLKCIHCYAESSPFNELESKIDFEKWKNVLDDSYNLNCRKVQFIGGEPTIYPRLNDLIVYARTIGFEFIEVYTNGTVINPEHIRTFIDNDVKVAFSVYGHNPEVHEKITNGKGSFKRTMKNIAMVKNSGIEFRISVIEMQENEKFIDEIVKFLQSEFGVKDVGIDKLREVGRGKKDSDDQLSQLCGNCWQGTLAINSDGEIFPCIFSRFQEIGNVEEGLSNVLNKDELRDFRTKIREIDESRKELVLEDGCRPVDECNPHCRPNCTPNCRPKDWVCRPW